MTALVTGASKGVGKGIALELARAGAAIIVNYNADQQGAQNTLAEIRSVGGEAIAIQADVGVAGDVDRMFRQARVKFARVQILVNNDGVQTLKRLRRRTDSEWE